MQRCEETRCADGSVGADAGDVVMKEGKRVGGVVGGGLGWAQRLHDFTTAAGSWQLGTEASWLPL